MASNRRSKDIQQPNISGLFYLVLVAITGFIVGSQYRPSNSVATQTQAEATQSPPNEVINQLQSALTQPQITTNTITVPVSEDAQSTSIVNINTASASELDTLPGIGPSYAKAIIDYRTKNGPFVRIEDLQQVKGIGPKTFEKLKDKITL